MKRFTGTLFGLLILILLLAFFFFYDDIGQAGRSLFLFSIALNLLFLFSRFLVNRKVRHLTDYIHGILDGTDLMDIRDNDEGELSLLKNELYKVMKQLRETSQRMSRDKLFLTNALSDITHQLKTPITSIMVMSDVLKKEQLSPEERKTFMRKLDSQLERLSWLVQSLLTLSKLDAGTIPFKHEEIHLKNWIQDTVSSFLIPMELKEIQFETHCPKEAVLISDPSWLGEALSNILKNAVEYTPQGGRILLSVEDTPFSVVIKVQDSGVGIDPKLLPKIFQRFIRDKSQKKESVGIGLAISKSLVTQLGGQLDVSSELGLGSCFQMKFFKA